MSGFFAASAISASLRLLMSAGLPASAWLGPPNHIAPKASTDWPAAFSCARYSASDAAPLCRWTWVSTTAFCAKADADVVSKAIESSRARMMSPVREGRNVPDLPQRMRAANYLEPDAIRFTTFVIASEAKQSRAVYAHPGLPRRFAPRNDDSN